jgi:REP element-mobilizing transposase RayT
MRPPRIPNLLTWEQRTVYFVTICVEGRRRVLDNPEAWAACRAVWNRLDRWEVLCAAAMPDHLHMIVAPMHDREESLSAFLKWFKRWFNEAVQPEWKWMEGGFDRLLRSDESIGEKWEYIRQNPVRAGLVERWEDWPFGFAQGELRL